MQYMAEGFKGITTFEVVDYTDMFSVFEEKIKNIKESPDVLRNEITSFCINIIGRDYMQIDEYKSMTTEKLNNALDILIELRDFIERYEYEPDDTPLSDVPDNLKIFYMVTKNISFFKNLKYSKSPSRAKRQIKVNDKTKMFF